MLGGAAATAALALLYPLDNIQTRMQQQRKKTKQVASGPLQTTTASNNTTQSTIQVVNQLIKEEGIAGLYSGFTSGLFAMVVSWFSYYYTYRVVQQNRVVQRLGIASSTSAWSDLLNGTVAGTITCVLTNPLWVMNTRIKLRGSDQPSQGYPRELWSLISEEGVAGLLQGIGPALVLVSNPALQFMCAEQFRRYLALNYGTAPGPIIEFCIGAITKLIATILTYPYNVIKTRMQENANVAHSAMEIAANVFNDGGMRAFFAGLDVTMVQKLLNSALMFGFHKLFLQGFE